MAHTCSECTYMDFSKEYDSGDGRFWCETKYEWHYANDAECWRYCTAYSRSSSTAKSYYDYSASKQSSGGGCFITTIVCEILGKKDDDKVLNSLRKFRDNVMQKDEKYRYILAQYDIIGPMIANRIKEDQEKDELAVALYNSAILTVSNYIEKEDYLNAVKLYTEMTEGLLDRYNIDRKISLVALRAMDIKKAGHGKYQKLNLGTV